MAMLDFDGVDDINVGLAMSDVSDQSDRRDRHDSRLLNVASPRALTWAPNDRRSRLLIGRSMEYRTLQSVWQRGRVRSLDDLAERYPPVRNPVAPSPWAAPSERRHSLINVPSTHRLDASVASLDAQHLLDPSHEEFTQLPVLLDGLLGEIHTVFAVRGGGGGGALQPTTPGDLPSRVSKKRMRLLDTGSASGAGGGGVGTRAPSVDCFVALHVSIREVHRLLESTVLDAAFVRRHGVVQGNVDAFMEAWASLLSLVKAGRWDVAAELSAEGDARSVRAASATAAVAASGGEEPDQAILYSRPLLLSLALSLVTQVSRAEEAASNLTVTECLAAWLARAPPDPQQATVRAAASLAAAGGGGGRCDGGKNGLTEPCSPSASAIGDSTICSSIGGALVHSMDSLAAPGGAAAAPAVKPEKDAVGDNSAAWKKAGDTAAPSSPITPTTPTEVRPGWNSSVLSPNSRPANPPALRRVPSVLPTPQAPPPLPPRPATSTPMAPAVFLSLSVVLFACAAVVVACEFVLLVAMLEHTDDGGAESAVGLLEFESGAVARVGAPVGVLAVAAAVAVWMLLSWKWSDTDGGALGICRWVLYAASLAPLVFIDADMQPAERPWSGLSFGWVCLLLPAWLQAALALAAAHHAESCEGATGHELKHVRAGCVLLFVSLLAKAGYSLGRMPSSHDLATIPAVAAAVAAAGNATDPMLAETVSVDLRAAEVATVVMNRWNLVLLVLLLLGSAYVCGQALLPFILADHANTSEVRLYRNLLLSGVAGSGEEEAARQSLAAQRRAPGEDPSVILHERNTKLFEYSDGAVDIKVGFTVEEKLEKPMGASACSSSTANVLTIEGVDNSVFYNTFGVIVCDLDFEIVHWNYRMWHHTGTLPDQATGTSLSSHMDEAYYALVVQKANESLDISNPALTATSVVFHKTNGQNKTRLPGGCSLDVFGTPGIPRGTDNFLLHPTGTNATHYVLYCTGVSELATLGPSVICEMATKAPTNMLLTQQYTEWLHDEIIEAAASTSSRPTSIGRLRKVSARCHAFNKSNTSNAFVNIRALMKQAVQDFRASLTQKTQTERQGSVSSVTDANSPVTLSIDSAVPELIYTNTNKLSSILLGTITEMADPKYRTAANGTVAPLPKMSLAVEMDLRASGASEDTGGALAILGATILNESMRDGKKELRSLVFSLSVSNMPMPPDTDPDTLFEETSEAPASATDTDDLPDLNLSANQIGGYMYMLSTPSGGLVVRLKLPCFDNEFVKSVVGDERITTQSVARQSQFRNTITVSAPNGTTSAALESRKVSDPSNVKCVIIDDCHTTRNMLCLSLWERGFAVVLRPNLSHVGPSEFDVVIANVTSEDAVRLDDLLELFKTSETCLLLMSSFFSETEVEAIRQASLWWNLALPLQKAQAESVLAEVETKIALAKETRQEIEDIRKAFTGNAQCPWVRGKCLGVGSFGKVYEATNNLTGGKMACKIVELSNCENHEAIFREVTVMAALSHPNIIHYFYCERGEEELRIFMELADCCLTSKIPEKGIHASTASQYMKDIILGLRYIHSKNLVHRDMKVANVLMHKGVCKLIDFGTVIETKASGKGKSDGGNGGGDSQVMNNSISGTPHYMAPEALDGRPFSWRSDIWALGCMLMEMLSGKPPWYHCGSGSWQAVKYVCAAAKTPEQPLNYGPYEFHDAVLDFFRVTLAINPQYRISTTQLLETALLKEMNDDYVRKASVMSFANCKRKESIASFARGKVAPAKGLRVKASKPAEGSQPEQISPEQGDLNDNDDRRGTTFSGWGG
eukprot:Rhum_TRINITY_DN14308_c37_g1::Rhum_TRINITY_DN14308_c37_g1_i1::g.80899::m.80899